MLLEEWGAREPKPKKWYYEPDFCQHLDWSDEKYLCPQHNGTLYRFCLECGVMRLDAEYKPDEVKK